MGQVVFQAWMGTDNYAINASGKTFDLVKVSGAFPAANYRITAASLYMSDVNVESERRGFIVKWNNNEAYYIVNQTPSGQAAGDHQRLTYACNITNVPYENTASLALFSTKGNTTSGVVFNLRAGSTLTLTVTYEETTTAVGAPTWFSLSASLTEGNVTGSWGGATAGINNAITGYDIQYRDSAEGVNWTAWADYSSVGSVASASLAPNSTRGHYRQFRIRTKGSAGSSFYSGWTLSPTVRRNRAPLTPAFIYPVANQTSYSQSPRLAVQFSAEPDGQAQTVQLSVDGGDYGAIYQASAAAGSAYVALPALGVGTHSLSLRMLDAMGAVSGVTQRTIQVANVAWTRAIATGTRIAGGGISHQADITQMLSRINAVRAFYGLAAATLTGVGRWAAWRENMLALQTAMTAVYQATGRATPSWTAVPVYPTAAIINQIRSAIAAA